MRSDGKASASDRAALDETAVAPAADRPTAAAAPSPMPEGSHTLTGDPRAASSEPGAPLAASVRLGHFRIERRLGAGGMGEVYLATDLALDRPVAVKVLPAGVSSGTARERLVREARAQARVHHPNVAHIYFIGEEDDRLYFAMEHVAGGTLADRLARGPLPVEDALSVIHAAALGLREAQRSGFLHRDVKPSNLMVDAHGMVKVVDFGLAAGGSEDARDRPLDGPVAQTTMAGTPLYMAPEQARGEPIDLRADIYALGATLYHLVSGRPPFEANTVDALVTLHASAARPNVPRGANPRTAITAVDALIAKMMAPRPADRFASYDELLHALELASVQQTRPAGFWARAMATGLDLLVIALTLGFSASAIGLELEVNAVVFPLVALFQVLAIGKLGRTLGKALFELEVVGVDTGTRPSWGQAIRRALVQWTVPSLLGVIGYLTEYFETPAKDLPDLLLLGAFFVLAGLLVHASLRVPGKRAPWDRVAGTLVRYQRRGDGAAARVL